MWVGLVMAAPLLVQAVRATTGGRRSGRGEGGGSRLSRATTVAIVELHGANRDPNG